MGKSFWVNERYDTRWGRVFGAILAFMIFLSLALASNNILYIEGVPVTIEGRVQTVTFAHDKFWNYDYTVIELQTYSGDTYSYTHYTFLEHLNVTFDESCRITYTRTSLLGHHFIMYNKVIEIQSLQGKVKNDV